VHPAPERALSDGDQSLDLEEFREMMQKVAAFAEVAGRSLEPTSRAAERRARAAAPAA